MLDGAVVRKASEVPLSHNTNSYNSVYSVPFNLLSGVNSILDYLENETSGKKRRKKVSTTEKGQ
jgi:hypothetical protein